MGSQSTKCPQVVLRGIESQHALNGPVEFCAIPESKAKLQLCGDKTLLGGPGSIASALGISTERTGASLMDGEIWIEDDGIEIDAVNAGPRVGIDYAGEDAALPYRFMTKVVQ